MAQRGRLLAAGLAALLVGIVSLFPARVAWHWFAPPGVAMSGITGTVWRGSANAGDAAGIYLRDLNWRFLPTRLLTGTVAWKIDAVPSSGFVNTEIGVGIGGDIVARDLRASVPLGALEAVIGMPGLAGTANASFPVARLSGGVPEALDGTVDIVGLLLPLVAPTPLGRYRAEFQTQGETIVASVQDDGAMFDIAGRLQISRDRSYEFLGQVAATAETPERVREQMQYLGSPDAQGRYELRLSGRY